MADSNGDESKWLVRLILSGTRCAHLTRWGAYREADLVIGYVNGLDIHCTSPPLVQYRHALANSGLRERGSVRFVR